MIENIWKKLSSILNCALKINKYVKNMKPLLSDVK